MEDLLLAALVLLAAFAGGLFARYFPRLGVAIGTISLVGTWGAYLWLVVAASKLHFLIALLLGTLALFPALIVSSAAASMISVGRGVIEDEQEQTLVPRDLPAPQSPFTADIDAYIARRFAHDSTAVRARIVQARTPDGNPPSPRLVRCALVASDGSLDALERHLRRLPVAPADVIEAGECAVRDGHLVRVRDLSGPIPEGC